MQPKRLRPVDVALKKDLYIRDVGHGPDDSVERFLADSIESPFSAIHNRIVHGARVGLVPSASALSREDRSVVARFLAFQMLRTPVERDAARWLGELGSLSVVRENLGPGAELRRDLEQSLGRSLIPEDVEAFHEFFVGLPQLRGTTDDWLPRTLRNAERFAPLIERLEWRIVKVPSSVELVTCDMPLVCVRRGTAPGFFEIGGAIAESGFEATLALSPSYVLFLTDHVEDEHVLRTEAFARSVRCRTIAYAQRWVYARALDEQISQALSASPTPCYYIEFNGRAFSVGHPVKEIERAARAAGVSSLQFRYGVPRTRQRDSKNRTPSA